MTLLLADLILVLHTLFVVFVVFGLVFILLGGARGWHWVRNPWFRWLHLLAIATVVAQAWLGILCPLTTLEMRLREQGGGDIYAGSFVAHWLDKLLYYHAPGWVFMLVYTVFGLAVLISWFLVKPSSLKRK